MTRREEEIVRVADENYSGYSERRLGFMAGANWADKHPNLYNDEKYHTVKVSCLDELNRKAELYDVFLDKACEWLKINIEDYDAYDAWRGNYTDIEALINDFKRAMEE